MQKIKDFLAAAHDALLFVLAPLALVAGFIFYLLARVGGLKDQVAAAKRGEEIAKLTDKQAEADRIAAASRDAYERAKRGQGPLPPDHSSR